MLKILLNHSQGREIQVDQNKSSWFQGFKPIQGTASRVIKTFVSFQLHTGQTYQNETRDKPQN